MLCRASPCCVPTASYPPPFLTPTPLLTRPLTSAPPPAPDALYWTSPRRLKAGQPALLFFNRQHSTPLAWASGDGGAPNLVHGANGWAGGAATVAMTHMTQLPPRFGGDVWAAHIKVGRVCGGDQQWAGYHCA